MNDYSSGNRNPSYVWEISSHLSGLALFIAIPFANVLAPLVIWLLKKDELPSVEAHAKEALNFQITVTIYLAISLVLCLIFIGFILLVVVALLDIILITIAAVHAGRGELYRYPLTLRLVQ